jgi:replicative DNA helicase
MTEAKLPYNVEAEAALLGAMMIDNKVIDGIADTVAATDFYEPLHGRMFDVATSLYAQGKTVTPVTLKTFFEADEAMKALGGIGYLAKLTGSGAALVGARDFAAQIKELSERRRIILALDEARIVAMDTAASMPDLSSAVERAVEVSGDDQTVIEVGIAKGAQMLFNEHASGGGVRLPGIKSLDKLLAGIKKKQLLVVAGRPGMGKTAVAVSCAMDLAAQNIGVVFITKEMSASELTGRCLSDRMFNSYPIAYEKIANGWMSEDERARISRLASDLDKMPLAIIDSGKVTPARVNVWVRRWKRRFAARGIELGLVIIDYLQLMDPDKDLGSRYANITDISGKLKQVAKEQDVPVMALAQLSREVEKRDDKRPKLSDLKDTGAIEQDADMILFLLREQYYLEQSKPDDGHPDMLNWQQAFDACQDRIEFILAKKRNGRTGSSVGEFHGQFQAVRG